MQRPQQTAPSPKRGAGDETLGALLKHPATTVSVGSVCLGLGIVDGNSFLLLMGVLVLGDVARRGYLRLRGERRLLRRRGLAAVQAAVGMTLLSAYFAYLPIGILVGIYVGSHAAAIGFLCLSPLVALGAVALVRRGRTILALQRALEPRDVEALYVAPAAGGRLLRRRPGYAVAATEQGLEGIQLRLRAPRPRWFLPYRQISRVEAIDQGRRTEGLAVAGGGSEWRLMLGPTQARAMRELIASSRPAP
jgi:hypothetical protein